MERMRTHFERTLQQPQSNESLQPDTASKALNSPTGSMSQGDSRSQSLSQGNGFFDGEGLSRSQEEFFLNLFWQSYHPVIPIVDEGEFREHYESLWSSRSSERLPSALVDIILALSMQYGAPFVPHGNAIEGGSDKDCSIAGRWLYRRCRMLLFSEREVPSITTLQCHIYSAVYLENASFLNMTHKTLAVAVRTAHVLGVHKDAPKDVSPSRRNLVRRVWRSLVLLDSKTSMELGRPYLIHTTDLSLDVPEDDDETGAEKTESTSLPCALDGMSWLSFHHQSFQLTMAARAINDKFYERCTEIMFSSKETDIYNDPPNLELGSKFLLESVKALETWAQHVPDALRIPRQDKGEPFATGQSPLQLDPSVPLWLQRQRFLLELLYHSIAVGLHRPFIRFQSGQTPMGQTPVSDGHAVKCFEHAVTVTNLMSQILVSTNILNSWQQAYKFQWDATLCILGFALANPASDSTFAARDAVSTAINTFKTLGSYNQPAATSAAKLTRALSDKVDFITASLSHPLSPSSPYNSGTPGSTIIPQRQVGMVSPSLDPALNPLSMLPQTSPVKLEQNNLSAPMMMSANPYGALPLTPSAPSMSQSMDPLLESTLAESMQGLPTAGLVDFDTDLFAGFDDGMQWSAEIPGAGDGAQSQQL